MSLEPHPALGEETAPKRLWELGTWLLNRSATRAHKVVTAQLARGGARKDHYTVPTAPTALGTASQAELGRRLGLDRSDMSALIDELERDGLVVRERDEEDRRRNVVRLSIEGTAFQRRLDELVAEAQEEMFEPLSEEEREQLRALLTRVVEHHSGRVTTP